MIELGALWLPILLSAVFVQIASAILHIGPFWHRNDYPAVPDEDRTRAALGPLAIPPGEYMVPRCKDHAEFKTPEFQQKMNAGPVMFLTVRRPGPAAMGPTMLQWFVYLLVVATLSGYVASIALPPGAIYLQVDRFVATAAFMGIGLGQFVSSIWYGRKWSTTIKLAFDAVIYAFIMGGTFGWLWPKAVAG